MELIGREAVLQSLRTQLGAELELVGVEYILFQDDRDAAHPQSPVLFGHPLHLAVRCP